MFSSAQEDVTVATGAQPSGSDETAAPQSRCVLFRVSLSGVIWRQAVTLCVHGGLGFLSFLGAPLAENGWSHKVFKVSDRR
jgi:hypothetical protein